MYLYMYVCVYYIWLILLSQLCGSESFCVCRKEVTVNQFNLRIMEESTYREYYHGVQHWNYFTEEPDIGPIILSLKQEPCGEKFRYHRMYMNICVCVCLFFFVCVYVLMYTLFLSECTCIYMYIILSSCTIKTCKIWMYIVHTCILY